MASVWLERDGLADEELPAVCVACGRHAEHRVPRTFSHIPPWVFILVLVNLLLVVIVALAVRQRQKAVVPVCDRHRGYWTRRTLLLGLSFLGLGLPPSSVSWGQAIANGRDYLDTAWWISAIPGLALTGLVVSTGLLGDHLTQRLGARR